MSTTSASLGNPRRSRLFQVGGIASRASLPRHDESNEHQEPNDEYDGEDRFLVNYHRLFLSYSPSWVIAFALSRDTHRPGTGDI